MVRSALPWGVGGERRAHLDVGRHHLPLGSLLVPGAYPTERAGGCVGVWLRLAHMHDQGLPRASQRVALIELLGADRAWGE